MQVNIRFTALGTLLLIAAVGTAFWMLTRHDSATTVETSVVAPELPVVMRTNGGLLEIATVRAFERFSRANTRQFWGIDLGSTVSDIQVTVVYRYHVEMAREWPIRISGKTAYVEAAEVQPSLPVAFDTGTMQKYSRSGWARFDKDENLEALERNMTAIMSERAGSASYRRLATEAGRKTVAEFVTIWLLKEQGWQRGGEYKVEVRFAGEPRT